MSEDETLDEATLSKFHFLAEPRRRVPMSIDDIGKLYEEQLQGMLRYMRGTNEQKHDGKLSEFYEVRYLENSYRAGKPRVFIGDGGHISDHIELEPLVALSLLTWLEQERATLEQLAKEQEP
jgi:hypothetical protein